MTCPHGVPIYVWCDSCDRLDASWDEEWHRTSARRRAGLAAAIAFLLAAAIVTVPLLWRYAR